MNANDFGKLLDEKLEPLTTEVEAFAGRLEALEDSVENDSANTYRIIQMQEKLEKLEKRLSTISGKLNKSATQKDMESIKKEIKSTEKKLIKRFDKIDKIFDKDLSKTMQRVKHIEEHVDIPPFQPVMAN